MIHNPTEQARSLTIAADFIEALAAPDSVGVSIYSSSPTIHLTVHSHTTLNVIAAKFHTTVDSRDVSYPADDPYFAGRRATHHNVTGVLDGIGLVATLVEDRPSLKVVGE